MLVKKQLKKKEVYISILSLFKTTTNLTNISKKLKVSKQNLNNYIRNLKEKGFIIHKGKGWYELSEKSKISTNYDELLPQDFIRGHAYVWKIKLNKKIPNYDKRIEILDQKKINYKLVGALKDIPRIKVLGRKVWLCKNNIRVFDKKDSSYYGQNSIEARKYALNELFLIVGVLESKLGVYLRPLDFEWSKEHYALIKNDLAIDQNRKGIIMRVSDELGEWLLIDDSLEKGGELETVGKKSFQTNKQVQDWWNDNKRHDFKITPTFLMESINKIVENQLYHEQNILSHVDAIKQMAETQKLLKQTIIELKEVINDISKQTR
jgi:biotin operon repressor